MAENFRHHRASPPAVIVVFEGGSPESIRGTKPPRYPRQQRPPWRPATRPSSKAERLARFLDRIAENDRIAREHAARRCGACGLAEQGRLMPPVTKAAGVIARSPQGRILMCKRVDGEGWAFPGGRQKAGETPEQCAWREFYEETNYRLGDVGKFLMRRIKDGTDFSTYIVDVPDEFLPKLNHEHNAHGWFDPADVLSGDAEPDDLEPEAGQAILDGLDKLEARLAAIGG